jgi:hypothetical protein
VSAGYSTALPTTVDAERRRLGEPRNGYTPCAVDGCECSVARGDGLYRVNPTGEAGIFMCEDHAQTERILKAARA